MRIWRDACRHRDALLLRVHERKVSVILNRLRETRPNYEPTLIVDM